MRYVCFLESYLAITAQVQWQSIYEWKLFFFLSEPFFIISNYHFSQVLNILSDMPTQVINTSAVLPVFVLEKWVPDGSTV